MTLTTIRRPPFPHLTGLCLYLPLGAVPTGVPTAIISLVKRSGSGALEMSLKRSRVWLKTMEFRR